MQTAFDRSELSWAQVRALCAVATPDTETAWLARARRLSARDLDALAKSNRPDCRSDLQPDGDDDLIDDEPAVRFQIACPARVRALWRHALELASRMAGAALVPWQAAEVIAAEAFSGRQAGASYGDRALLAAMRLARHARRRGTEATRTVPRSYVYRDVPATTMDAGVAGRAALAPPMAASHEPCAAVAVADAAAPTPAATARCVASTPVGRDPFALDARLCDAMRTIRTVEPRIGHLLRIVVDLKLYRTLHCATVDSYVRERLGISARKAWALLKIQKTVRRTGAFAQHYADGRLPWTRALMIVPVVDRCTEDAWLARAGAVTAQRLADEVSYVLERRDALGSEMPLEPPPLDSTLVSPVAELLARECRTKAPSELQNGAPASEMCDVVIQFTGPTSVVALLRDTMDAFAWPGEPRWVAFERVLRHAVSYWQASGRHRDPVFARDGWRCAVPGCTSRRNLHDHHLQYRSRGGSNERENRVPVCAGHHLHGIHAGTIRAWGTAPRPIFWQLGVRPGLPPLLAFVGDRLLDDAADVI